VLKAPPARAAEAPAAPAAASAAADSPAATSGPIAAAAAAAPERIFAVADLPAALQSELPKLAISGGVHSENAAQRLLIVGGQLKSEGAEIAPGVVLEQIRARTAVLRFKGFRYSLPY
jgi:general secretion pathway protein B